MADQLVLPDLVHHPLYKRQILQKFRPHEPSHLHGLASGNHPFHNVMLSEVRHHRHFDIQISPVCSEHLFKRGRFVELPELHNKQLPKSVLKCQHGSEHQLLLRRILH